MLKNTQRAFASMNANSPGRSNRFVPNLVHPSSEEVFLLREHLSGIASMSAGGKALRNATGIDHDSNRTFEVRASPWMVRCRDGLMPRCQEWQGAVDMQNNLEVLRFSLSDPSSSSL